MIGTKAVWRRGAVTAGALLLGLAGDVALAQAQARPTEGSPAEEEAPPFSPIVRAGDFLFPAGQLGLLPSTRKLAPGGIDAETRQALGNLRDILASHGASLDDVVRCTAYLVDMGEWPAFNRAYREFFKAPFPARTAVGVSALAFDARVELECLAYKPAEPRNTADAGDAR